MTVECHKRPNEARPDHCLQVAGFGSETIVQLAVEAYSKMYVHWIVCK